MKTLRVLRWGIGGEQVHEFEFNDEAVMEVLADGNVAILYDAEDNSDAQAFFGGIAEARWTE